MAMVSTVPGAGATNWARAKSDCWGGDYTPTLLDDLTGSNGSLGWEFDRENLEFAVVDAHGRLFERRAPTTYRTLLPESVITQDLEYFTITSNSSESQGESSRARNTPRLPAPGSFDDIQEELLQEPWYRKSCYMVACIDRKVTVLRKMFKEWSGDRLSEHKNEEGSNGLVLAAADEDALPTIKFLKERGVDINHHNHYGRTPLMEAALWGRFDNVRYLLSVGSQMDVRDGNGMTAFDLAASSKRNTGERRERSGLSYREPPWAEEDRQRIIQYFQQISQPRPAEHTDTTRTGASFFHNVPGIGLAIYRPVLQLVVPDDNPDKAFAELDRGLAYPLIRAMSGYSQQGWDNVLDNELWTRRARILRRHLGVHDGRSFSSHVEFQLLAYLLFHHSLLSINGLYIDSDGDSSDGSTEIDDDWKIDAGHGHILSHYLPAYILQPLITVNKPKSCQECRNFKIAMQNRFPELNITFRFVGDTIGAGVNTEAWGQ